MTTFASVQAQFFNNGAALTGVDPNGVDSGEVGATARLRGRYRKWTACTDGGLFGFEHAATDHQSPSGMLRNILWNLPGVTAITFAWIDMDGLVVPWNTNAGTPGIVDMQQQLLFMPRGHLRVTATGNLNAAGVILTLWEKGLVDDTFAHVASLGSMNLP